MMKKRFQFDKARLRLFYRLLLPSVLVFGITLYWFFGSIDLELREYLFISVFGFVSIVFWTVLSRKTSGPGVNLWNYAEGFIGSAILLVFLWLLAQLLCG